MCCVSLSYISNVSLTWKMSKCSLNKLSNSKKFSLPLIAFTASRECSVSFRIKKTQSCNAVDSENVFWDVNIFLFITKVITKVIIFSVNIQIPVASSSTTRNISQPNVPLWEARFQGVLSSVNFFIAILKWCQWCWYGTGGIMHGECLISLTKELLISITPI